jgi:O-acetyl-ADP-ribose deacetylase (regulator of RNase III)
MTSEIPIVKGNLLHCDVDMIVQQCNCLTVTAHGLSQSIKTELNVDPYGHRECMKGRRNCAVKADRGIPGSVTIYKRKNKIPMYVACLFAQFSPSRPGIYYQEIFDEHKDPVTDELVTDSFEQRFIWFERGLQKLAQRALSLGCKTIGFPFQIGCGLAGGDWNLYLKALTMWAELNQDSFKVTLYKLD